MSPVRVPPPPVLPPSPSTMSDVPSPHQRASPPVRFSGAPLRMRLDDQLMEVDEAPTMPGPPSASNAVRFTQGALSGRNGVAHNPVAAANPHGRNQSISALSMGAPPPHSSVASAGKPSAGAIPQSSLSRLRVQSSPTAEHAGGSYFAPTPQAAGSPQPPTPASSLSALPSPSAAAYAPPSLPPSTVHTLLQHLRTMSPPASLSPTALQEHVSTLGTASLPLGPNSFVDVRDPLGKWLEAQVVRIEWTHPQHHLAHLKIRVHYLNWDEKWDEWMMPIQDPARIAAFKTWSDMEMMSPAAASAAAASGARTVPPSWARKDESVIAYFQGDNKKRASGWMLGRITKEHGPQMQVEMQPPLLPSFVPTPSQQAKGNKVQRWFHAHSDLIMPITQTLTLLKEQQRQQQQQQEQQRQASASVTAAAASAAAAPASSNRASETTPPSHPVSPAAQQSPHPVAASSAVPPSGGPQSPLSVYSQSASGQGSLSLSLPISQTQFPITALGRQSSSFLLAASPPPESLPSLTPTSASHDSQSTPPATQPLAMDGVSPAAAPVPAATASAPAADPAWFVGQFLEVQDSVGKFLPAEVLQVSEDGGRIYVHYSNFSARWDEWVDVVTQASRIRALGSALEESEEEKARKAAEQSFRTRLQQETGFSIVDCDADGNCMFRAVSHQIYGSVDRHSEVRAACCQYLERNASYFRTFIADEPIESYVATRRGTAWGDHLELVAMREMFNKQVEIYRHDAPAGAKPITIGATFPTPKGFTVPVMRLSFHGKNHYNSVVDPAHPPPLGDGHDSPVDMRQLRLRQEAQEAAEADQRAEREKNRLASSSRSSSSSPVTTPSSPGGSSSGASSAQHVVRSLSGRVNIPSPRRGLNSPPVHPPPSPSPSSPAPAQPDAAEQQPPSPLDPRSVYPESALHADWSQLDSKGTHLLAERHVSQLIGRVADAVYRTQREHASKRAQPQRLEALDRAHQQLDDGGGIETLSSDMLAAVQPVQVRTVTGATLRKIPMGAFSHHLYQHTLPHILAALAK